MEIGSTSSMVGMMGMQGGMSGMQRPEPPDAEEMSSKFVDAMDSDGDGQLSQSEFSVKGDSESSESSEVFDALDTNEDGYVSQEELQADMQSKMDSGQAPPPPPPGGGSGGMFSGLQQDGDMQSFQQLMNMSSSTDQEQATDRYSQMQEAMFGTGSYAQQSYSSGLNVSA